MAGCGQRGLGPPCNSLSWLTACTVSLLCFPWPADKLDLCTCCCTAFSLPFTVDARCLCTLPKRPNLTGGCLQLLTRLQDRKAAVEKECARLPAAPKGKDIFHLCRGFERAFSHVVEVTQLPATTGLDVHCAIALRELCRLKQQRMCAL